MYIEQYAREPQPWRPSPYPHMILSPETQAEHSAWVAERFPGVKPSLLVQFDIDDTYYLGPFSRITSHPSAVNGIGPYNILMHHIFYDNEGSIVAQIGREKEPATIMHKDTVSPKNIADALMAAQDALSISTGYDRRYMIPGLHMTLNSVDFKNMNIPYNQVMRDKAKKPIIQVGKVWTIRGKFVRI